ncbi:MAG: hypothetical protein HY319_20460 [Armatimonadetes bacterium]|nr:hypothetical protein [Armatimonadota bacterium]
MRILLVCVMVLALAAAGAAETRDLLKQASSVVIVRATLKLHDQNFEREEEVEFPAVAVSREGLLMASDAYFRGRGSFQIEPVSIKVAVEEKEQDAVLLATDSRLGLAFLQVQGLGIPAVDFTPSSAGTAAVGDRVMVLTRMGKEFGYAPCLRSAMLSGQLVIPRPAWVLDTSIDAPSQVVYTESGAVFGILLGDALVIPATVVSSTIEQVKQTCALQNLSPSNSRVTAAK